MLQDSKSIWSRILTRSRARGASKAAVALVLPLVTDSRRRLGGIPTSIWSDPYIIGFVMTMITIVAKLKDATLEGTLLCEVQADAWAKITGTQPHLIGEEVLLLSASHHFGFELGCREAVELCVKFYCEGEGAVAFYRSSQASSLQDCKGHILDVGVRQDLTCRNTLDQMWAARFDAHCELCQ